METVSETLNVTSVSYSIWLITQEDIIEYSWVICWRNYDNHFQMISDYVY
jgi:hypothetical protein